MAVEKIDDNRLNEIKSQANQLLDSFKYDLERPRYVDVLYFAQKLGFDVRIGMMKNPAEQGFISIDKNSKVIGLNANLSGEIKRFVIAHELGHFLLHYDSMKESVYFHREDLKGKKDHEQEADKFAAYLLMPEEAFKKACNIYKSKNYSGGVLVTLLARLFQVPFESAQRRMGETECV